MIAYRTRENIFNKIMVLTRKTLYFILGLDRHKKFVKELSNEGYIPIMSYNPKLKKYRFNCYCRACPVNKDGLCSTMFYKIPLECLHEFDGDNIIKNYCG